MDASILSPTRVGLGIASLVLAGLLFLGFSAPHDGAVAASTSDGAGSSGSRSTGSTGSTGAPGTTGTTGTTGTGSAGSSPSPSGSTGSTGTSGTSGSPANGTFDGSVVDDRYGSVQVEITVSGGKVTAVTALQLPSGGRSGMISSYVEPILAQEAITAQSAQIDFVSGATYTSEGFAQSLQSALNQAGL